MPALIVAGLRPVPPQVGDFLTQPPQFGRVISRIRRVSAGRPRGARIGRRRVPGRARAACTAAARTGSSLWCRCRAPSPQQSGRHRSRPENHIPGLRHPRPVHPPAYRPTSPVSPAGTRSSSALSRSAAKNNRRSRRYSGDCKVVFCRCRPASMHLLHQLRPVVMLRIFQAKRE
jgi:hypothetical protein